MLSNKVKYALKALTHLAKEYGRGPVLIAEMAERDRIPKKFLELILLELRHHGLLASKKGKGGGYFLNRNPDLITVGQIIRLIDGPLALVACASSSRYAACAECPDESACGLRAVMKEVRDATARILDGTHLSELAAREQRAQERAPAPMFHI